MCASHTPKQQQQPGRRSTFFIQKKKRAEKYTTQLVYERVLRVGGGHSSLQPKYNKVTHLGGKIHLRPSVVRVLLTFVATRKKERFLLRYGFFFFLFLVLFCLFILYLFPFCGTEKGGGEDVRELHKSFFTFLQSAPQSLIRANAPCRCSSCFSEMRSTWVFVHLPSPSPRLVRCIFFSGCGNEFLPSSSRLPSAKNAFVSSIKVFLLFVRYVTSLMSEKKLHKLRPL